MLCAKSMILFSMARKFLTVGKPLIFVSVQSTLFRATQAIFTLLSAREGINLASYLDISSKFFTRIMLMKRMGWPPSGEDRKIVFLNASVFIRWKAIKCRLGLGFGSHRSTMYAETKTNDRRACWSIVGLWRLEPMQSVSSFPPCFQLARAADSRTSAMAIYCQETLQKSIRNSNLWAWFWKSIEINACETEQSNYQKIFQL